MQTNVNQKPAHYSLAGWQHETEVQMQDVLDNLDEHLQEPDLEQELSFE